MLYKYLLSRGVSQHAQLGQSAGGTYRLREPLFPKSSASGTVAEQTTAQVLAEARFW